MLNLGTWWGRGNLLYNSDVDWSRRAGLVDFVCHFEVEYVNRTLTVLDNSKYSEVHAKYYVKII